MIRNPFIAGLSALAAAAGGAVKALGLRTDLPAAAERKAKGLPMGIIWPSWERGTYVKAKHGDLRRPQAVMVPRAALRMKKA